MGCKFPIPKEQYVMLENVSQTLDRMGNAAAPDTKSSAQGRPALSLPFHVFCVTVTLWLLSKP
jgi:hypothetical protein